MPHLLLKLSPASVNVAVADFPYITEIVLVDSVGALKMSPVQSALLSMAVKV